MNKIKLQQEIESTKDDDPKVNFEVSSKKNLQVPYINFYQFSGLVQEEVNRNYIFNRLSNLMKETQERLQIEDESVATFIRLLNKEEVDMKADEICDLIKLSEVFKIESLKATFIKYIEQHMEDIDMLLGIKISQERNEESKHVFTDEISTTIERCLKDNINEILENEKANQLSVSTIYRMIEASNQQRVSSVILYRFITSSINERKVLLKFVRLEELSDETIDEIFMKYEKGGMNNFFEYLGGNIKYIKEVREQQKMQEKRIRELEEITKNLNKKNEEQQRQITELTEINQQFQEDLLRKDKENEKQEQLNKHNKEELNKKQHEIEQLTKINQKLTEQQTEFDLLNKNLNQINVEYQQKISELTTINQQAKEEISRKNKEIEQREHESEELKRIKQQLSEQQKEMPRITENDIINKYIEKTTKIREEEDRISFEIIKDLLNKYGDLTYFNQSGIH